MKGSRFLDELRMAGITGTDLTITGAQASALSMLCDELIPCTTGKLARTPVPIIRITSILSTLEKEVSS